MDDKNIVTVNEVRDINTVTTEINTLVHQYRSLTLAYAVEVGRRLTEAKSLLPHGEWGSWLSERVSFSQRTASNLMRVFEEYGDSQITLFGAVPNSHAIANLPLTHAIKLLLLPAEEREEFVETEDVASMSTRELEEAIKARKAAEDRVRERAEENEKLQTELEERSDDASGAEIEALEKERNRALDDAQRLRAEAAHATEALKAAQEAAEKAKSDAKKAKDKLKELKEHPEIPKDVLEKLSAEASEKADAALQEQITEANRKVAEAEQRCKEAEAKYEHARKAAQVADPAVMSFKALFEQIQDTLAKLHSTLYSIREHSPEMAEKLCMALERFAGEVVPK